MRDLGKFIAAKGFKKLPKSNKLPNLVKLVPKYLGDGLSKLKGSKEQHSSHLHDRGKGVLSMNAEDRFLT